VSHRTDIAAILNDPELARDADRDFLEELTQRYPFFQSAQLMYCLHLRQTGHFDYTEQLSRTSIQALDRERLYALLYQEPLHRLIDDVATEPPVEEVAEEPVTEPKVVPPAEESRNSDTSEPPAFDKPIPLTQVGKRGIPAEDLAFLEDQILEEALNTSYSLELATKDEEPASEEPVKQEALPESSSTSHEPASRQSFTNWLKILDKERLDQLREQEPAEPSEQKKERQANLIEQFIASDPQISKVEKDVRFSPTNLPKLDRVADESFVTETLAKVYERQGNHQKAKEIYEKLQLKYPEKKSYFAALIENLDSKS